ncbi:UPF0158 family protein [Rhizobium leguminosarum]|uniref:UPF0158 family protein n=1 Tax=Rhizobium leguminosarum TaxID=384 RepID=UPI002795E9C5|nr:UPF0158 family protein [Rhizobium leguminosarum]
MNADPWAGRRKDPSPEVPLVDGGAVALPPDFNFVARFRFNGFTHAGGAQAVSHCKCRKRPHLRPIWDRVISCDDRLVGGRTSMAVDFRELLDAFEFVTSVGIGESTAFLCKKTGKIYWHSDWADDVEELPDIEDSEEYTRIPEKNELDLGKPLVLKFARHHLPDDSDKILEIFSRAGAYARFKDLLEHRHAIDRWYAFERQATEEALRTWCEDNDIEVRG